MPASSELSRLFVIEPPWPEYRSRAYVALPWVRSL